MADIFGREMQDYKHLQYLESSGRLAVAKQEWAQQRGYPPHDFNALDTFQAMPFFTRVEENAQAVGFLTNNLQAIMAIVDEVLYTRDRLTEMIPLAMDVPEGVATYSYRVVDRAGTGRYISFDGTDAPDATISQTLVAYTLEYAGIVPRWTMEDFRRAQVTGLPLDSLTIESGIKGAMNHIEQVAFTGDKSKNQVGLTNLPVPTINQTPTGNQVNYISTTDQVQSLTADQQITFLQQHTTNIVEDTAEVFGGTIEGDLCIYMPISAAASVANTRVPDTGMNTWDYFRRNNTWTSYTGREPMLKYLQELDTAGAVSSGGNDRYIWALKDRMVMEMAIPIMPRILSILNEGYSVSAPIEYKISGLNVKRPRSITYIDPS